LAIIVFPFVPFVLAINKHSLTQMLLRQHYF
jgi:hypothetical protein